MNLVVGALVALVAGVLAGLVMKRGGYGLRWDITLGLTGSIIVSGIFQTRWVSPDPGMVAATTVAAVGAAGLIVAQRKLWPAIA
jgi:uncharacterized membrane protein YeaQ/YmgE (transglycosylase-associated protein family)